MKSVKLFNIVFFSLLAYLPAFAQDVTVTVNALESKRAVSPYIYGRNESFDKPAAFYKDAGLRFARCNAGNNATKYNWRRKITSHPDWYNNVYTTDWDQMSKTAALNNPGVQVMWAFQLLGRVASSKSYNFNDWAFNQSKYWEGTGQNLAGGGTVNTTGINPSKAAVDGDINLYTMEWPADSTVAILDHFFNAKPTGLGLNKDQFRYWSMDNEADIWDGTHNDVMPNGLLPASEFMDRFIEVAKKARALFPEIKICGPVTTSEWQWYKWGNESIWVGGKYYSWFEYFIKRCADEEKASGVRVLDVFDIHHYPYAPANSDALQNHRAFYDINYIYPGANGVKTINGGWDNSQNKEYIFKRIEGWLNLHYGTGHGITLGLSEWSPGPSEPNLASVIYSTHLGTFANTGVEFFSPWNWFTGMWESLHLYSRYAKEFSVSSVSSQENSVSAYSTVNASTDSMTVIVVNRDMNSSKTVTVNLNNFNVSNGNYTTRQLSALPANETFVSHTNNALKTNSITVNSNSFNLSVPALSTTAVILKSGITGVTEVNNRPIDLYVYPNPASNLVNIKIGSGTPALTQVLIYDLSGRIYKECLLYYDGFNPLTIDVSDANSGIYLLSVKNKYCSIAEKMSVIK